jgi:hypothetical protein
VLWVVRACWALRGFERKLQPAEVEGQLGVSRNQRAVNFGDLVSAVIAL